MNAEIAHKRNLLHQRQAIAHNNLHQLRHDAKNALGTPPVLMTAFAVGYFARVVAGRSRSEQTDPNKKPKISPITQRITVLGGALLGTALRSTLMGLGRDLFRASSEESGNRSEHA